MRLAVRGVEASWDGPNQHLLLYALRPRPDHPLLTAAGTGAACDEAAALRASVRHPVSTSGMARGSDQYARPTRFAEKKFADSHRSFFVQADPNDRVGQAFDGLGEPAPPSIS
jgi:hypothetical protein